MAANTKICVKCGEDTNPGDMSKVHPTGLATLLSSARAKNDENFEQNLLTAFMPHIHNKCRREYNDKRKWGTNSADTENDAPAPKLRRSLVPTFQWKTNCVICSESAYEDLKHPDRNPVHRIEYLEMGKTLLELCDKIEPHDKSVGVIKNRIRGVDLVAAEARYHFKCYLNKLRNVAAALDKPVVGIHDEKQEHLSLLCQWLETESDLDMYTISDLHGKMVELSNGGNVYGEKYLLEKLQSHYGEHIFVAPSKGRRRNVVCFRDMASFIIGDKWYNDRNANVKDDSKRIILAAAKLLREEIRAMPYSKELYPSLSDFEIDKCEEFLCGGLKLFMQTLVGDRLKSVSIGQCITQACRPRSVIAPIPFGYAVQIHHVYGTEWGIQQSSSLGFSVSYDEVTRFRQSALQQNSLETLVPPPFPSLAQYGADNADSNIKTLTGSGTFHAMAHYAWFRKSADSPALSSRVKRMARTGVNELVRGKEIPVLHFADADSTSSSLSQTRLVPIADIVFPDGLCSKDHYSLLLWRSTLTLRDNKSKADDGFDWRNWSGYMHFIHRDDKSKVDECMLLPIIDLDPNDIDCVYSTLHYISDQARRLLLPATSITFDQPLYLLALDVAITKGISNVVIRLGGFHLLMSALGSVYNTMKGSGVDVALDQVYASGSIPQIMTGKAYSRSIRSIHLLSAALYANLLKKVGLDGENELLTNLCGLMTEMQNSTRNPLEIIEKSKDLAALDNLLCSATETMSFESRTSKLWIQFLSYIAILEEFVLSERTLNWNGHLNSCRKMLNLFAGTGHCNYAKSTRIYLQKMAKLEEEHPWLHRKFVKEGAFSVQRSDHPFNGIWSDMVIEQVVMASLKSCRGGLTHGRGLTESVRHQWVYSLHAYAAVHQAMLDLTERRRRTSEQHVKHADLGRSRIRIDNSDVDKFFSWFEEHDPFTDFPDLRSLSTGITASSDQLNCDKCEEVGMIIQLKMDKVLFGEIKIPRKLTISTLQSLETGIVVGNKKLDIDPRILFSRLNSIAQRQELEISTFLEYEMSTSPPSLFDGELMRKAEKSTLGNYLLGLVTPDIMKPPVNSDIIKSVVIDGGWLMQKVRWSKRLMYGEIANAYVKYVAKFGKSTVVFDGYDASTKDHEHLRRKAKSMSASIEVMPDRRCQNEQDVFLANSQNKERLIDLVETRLVEAGHSVFRSKADADVDIVRVTLDWAKHGHVLLMGEDTDLLIMLLHHVHYASDEYPKDISFGRIPKKSNVGNLYSIRGILEKMDEMLKDNILFVHGWGGCDTTSATFNHGKLAVLKMLQKNETAVECAKAFLTEGQDKALIGKIGGKMFSLMYGSEDELALVRLQKYQILSDDPINFDPRRLPPTTRAAYFHSIRVYLQIQIWKNLSEALDPCSWGWELKNGTFCPIRTDMDIAPQILLKLIRCKCKSLQRQCGPKTACTCVKYGLKCVPACGGCHGQTCQNTEQPLLETDKE